MKNKKKQYKNGGLIMITHKEWEAIKDQFVGTMNYFKVFPSMYVTDGVKAMCDKLECYWLISELFAYREQVFNYGLIVAKIKVFKDKVAWIEITDGNYNKLAATRIPYTDMSEGEYEIWMQPTSLMDTQKPVVICMLPSEY